MFVDIHCHLEHPLLSQRLQEVLDDMQKNSVFACTAGTDLDSNKKAVAYAVQHKQVGCFLGVYPRYSYHEAMKDIITDDEFEACMTFITQQKDLLLGIGEIGLDFSQHYNQKQQEEDFVEQCELASRWNKPVLIHSRKAEQRVFELLETTSVKKVILHAFSGKKKLVQKGVEQGYTFSIPTAVTRSQQFQENVKEIPLQQLLAETDAPFMSPFPDKTNEPAFVIEGYKKIAEIKKRSLDEVKFQLRSTVENLIRKKIKN